MQQSCFSCKSLHLETVFRNKSDSSRLELIILGKKTPKIPFVCYVYPGTESRPAQQNWQDGILSDGKLSLQTNLRHVAPTARFYRRSWQPEESTFSRHCQVPHTEIRGFPCLNRDFLNETIASARFSAEEAPVGSRAVLGWFLCFPEGSEHGAMAPQTRGARSSFAMSQVKSSAAELVTLMVLYSDI